MSAYTEEQLAALRTALAKGEKQVAYGDRSVTYRDIGELKAAIREIEDAFAKELAIKPVRQVRVYTSKGFL